MLKLGTQTGSLVNHIQSKYGSSSEPKVGDGATLLYWSDRKGATIIAYDGKILTVQLDDCKRIDKNGAYTECQDYEYTPNSENATYSFRKNKHGFWKEVAFRKETKRWVNVDGCGLRLGARDSYHDYSF